MNVDMQYSPEAAARPPVSERGKIEAILGRPISHEDCSASLPKGGKVKDIPSDTLILDTGAHDSFMADVNESSLADENIPALYRASIAAGVVDHHVIDSVLSRNGFKGEKYHKCSTQIATDYADDIKDYIEKNGVSRVNTHSDADLDAVSSSFLIKSLIQTGQLPQIGDELAKIVNTADYGRLKLNPEELVESMPGVFEAIRTVMKDRCEKEVRERVISDPDMLNGSRFNTQGFALYQEITKKYEDRTGEIFFEVLNAANSLKLMDPNYSLEDNFADSMEGNLSEKTEGVINEGKEKTLATFEKFKEDLALATQTEVQVENSEGVEGAANLLIARSDDPLLFTNMSYMQTPPNTIVAVYAGKERKGGDMYDIGIQPDQVREINLGKLCVALNKAEKGKRDKIYAKTESERTKEENELIEGLEKQDDRTGMSGPEQVLTKDPTVLVAGGTLIAASTKSLLEFEDFQKAVNSVF